uniref:Potassium channel domain-containing protein n=1 Tax=Alexandrium andersonii TaxID=327968 RepID=A0A7S2DC01_9DINO|mmetsp:Transcript_50474/g.114337  ORF Transcript_50474/g.114337 Transcript_50474/m.114337 type:complete len:211 (+) Transcript_50474:3-635(+)
MTCFLAVFGCAVVAQAANTGIMDFTQGLLLRLERLLAPRGSKAAMSRTQARLGSLLCLFTVLIGAIVFIGKNMLGLATWHDSFYFSIVTLTTVGFGDMVPSEPSHRLWMSLLMMVGVPVFAASLGSVVEALSLEADEKEDAASEATPSASKPIALEAFRDTLHRGAALPIVQREDYLAYTLVQKGMVKMEDIWEAWDEFRQISKVREVRA